MPKVDKGRASAQPRGSHAVIVTLLRNRCDWPEGYFDADVGWRIACSPNQSGILESVEEHPHMLRLTFTEVEDE